MRKDIVVRLGEIHVRHVHSPFLPDGVADLVLEAITEILDWRDRAEIRQQALDLEEQRQKQLVQREMAALRAENAKLKRELK